ncbi:MAG: hypothetical protein KJ847_00410, partial [Firmicutes bacterium]|nr:hypothetical protein [Bacillota bacterium]
YIVFEDNATQKHINAVFNQGNQPKVIMNTETINDLRIYGKHQTKQEYDDMMNIVGELKEKIIKLTNYEEVLKFLEKEEDLKLLRHFGSEFVLVKLLKDVGYFQLESIYANMTDKFIESYSFFRSYVEAEKIELKQKGLTLEIYCDDVIYGKSYIYGGDEVTSSIFIKFPSGMSGTGGWDISPEFE